MKEEKSINNKINDAILTAKELSKNKYEKDDTTGVHTEVGYFEKRLNIFNKIFFWTIIFYPLMVVLNDIYENKFIHNNKFWIKKGIIYGVTLSIVYLLLLFTSQIKMNYLPINIFLIFGILHFLGLLQKKFGNRLFVVEKEKLITKGEMENIIKIQQIDLNKKNKIKLRITFFVFFIMFNIFIFQFKSHYLATLLSFCVIVIYDNYEQRYFKRNKTYLFWEKRIVFYIFVIVPILIITTFLIYDTLIFKY